MRLTVRTVPADVSPAAELLEAMVVEVGRLYDKGRIDTPDAPSASPADFAPPGGTFLVLFDEDERPVAAGGVKRLGDDVAEIKRMYVVPEARGQGVARRLLTALEVAARELGYARVRLDTGVHQHSARALYDSAGYREIADYNGNPFASFWGEKAL